MKKQVTKSPKAPGAARPKGQNPAKAQNPVLNPVRRQRSNDQRSMGTSANPARQKSAASAYATGTSAMAPKMEASRDSCRIVHRELLASITGSSAFAIAQSLALNPGLAATFPWLSTQARNWEQYRFNKLKFCYYTRTGSNMPGSVQLIPDYDAADAAPVSEQAASSYEDTVEDAPWKDIECQLRAAAMFPMGPKKYVRIGALSSNLDIKTYDAGTLFVATTDGTTVSWGKLWVEYDVTLFTPQNESSSGVVAASQHVTSVNPTTGNILPTPVTQAGSSSLVSVSGQALTFLQPGRFLVTLNQVATNVSNNATPVAAVGGALVATYGGSYAPGSFTSQSGGTNTQGSCSVLMDAVVGSTLTYTIVLTTGTFSELFVAQVPSIQT